MKYKIICKNCNIEFETNNKINKFCSNQCKDVYKKEYVYEYNKIKCCEECGKNFTSICAKSRFCSKDCVNIWQRRIKWEDRIGEEKAKEIRESTSERVSGDGNPSKNPEVAKKIGKALKQYLLENPKCGEKNPFFGKKHTEDYKKKSSESKVNKWAYTQEQYEKLCENTPKGKDHPNWNGGSSSYPCPYPFGWTKLFKKHIKNIYNNKCLICQETNQLAIHHVDYNKNNSNINNLVPLCYSCHAKTNYNRDNWKEYFKGLIINE
jgi:hypothetical protein